MFLRASFAAWVNLYKKKVRDQKRQEIIAQAGGDEYIMKSLLKRSGIYEKEDE